MHSTHCWKHSVVMNKISLFIYKHKAQLLELLSFNITRIAFSKTVKKCLIWNSKLQFKAKSQKEKRNIEIKL